MRSLLSFFLFSALLSAQTSTLSLSGPAIVAPSGSITVAVTLSGTGIPAASEFVIQAPADVTSMTAAVGPAATAAGKGISCAPLTAGSLHCVVYASNQTTMAAGVIANVTATLVAAPVATTETFTLVAPEVEANLAATAITATVGPALIVPVRSPCDLNGDGKVDNVDTLAIVNWVLGISAPPTGFHSDMNGDGKSDALDVQIIANAAAGQACTGK